VIVRVLEAFLRRNTAPTYEKADENQKENENENESENGHGHAGNITRSILQVYGNWTLTIKRLLTTTPTPFSGSKRKETHIIGRINRWRNSEKELVGSVAYYLQCYHCVVGTKGRLACISWRRKPEVQGTEKSMQLYDEFNTC
jgi:hypothetical protein